MLIYTHGRKIGKLQWVQVCALLTQVAIYQKPGFATDQYRNYEIVLKFTRFLLLATPYERRLRIRSLSGNARDEMLLASLAVCKSAVTYLYNLEPGTGFAIPTHTCA